MSVNLSALSAVTNGITAATNLLLVNPQKNVGIQAQPIVYPDGSIGNQDPSFLFHYEGENVVMLESDITDHYVEDNTSLQDQIALKPEIVTTHGFIGELNDVTPELLEPLKFAADKLTILSPYTPALSTTALLAYNEAVFAYGLAKSAAASVVSAWATITGGSGANTQNKQQVAFNQFYQYWQNRQLFTVQTPWTIFKNMAIKSLRAIQDPDTRVITDFEITFKIVKFAKTSTSGQTVAGQGRWNSLASPLNDIGVGTLGPAVGQILSVA